MVFYIQRLTSANSPSISLPKANFGSLISRDLGDSASYFTPSMANVGILVAILASCGVGLLLYSQRHRRKQQGSSLPSHLKGSNHLPGQTEPVIVYHKRDLVGDSSNSNPIPQIRITFPDEVDNNGEKKVERVVVLRIADSGAYGMEPVEETLPPYRPNGHGRFQSLDLERMGGLREKQEYR